MLIQYVLDASISADAHELFCSGIPLLVVERDAKKNIIENVVKDSETEQAKIYDSEDYARLTE